MMGGDKGLKRRYSREAVKPSSDSDKNETKMKRRLRGKNMDYYQFSTFDYWYGHFKQKQLQHSFFGYCINSDYFKAGVLFFIYKVLEKQDKDEDRMPHGIVETLF